MFPRAPDRHKPGNPLVPNGLGVLYVLASTTYLFLMDNFDIINVEPSPALTLAVCILFGGFMGLLDDWMDLRWKYKAFFPLIASLPLVTIRLGNPRMATYFFGMIDFGIFFYIVIVPLIVTIVTNSVNQLGGLNGLETVCPLIVLIGLFTVSTIHRPGIQALLYVPIISYLILAYFNFRGKIFVGNTGSFAIGITLASYAIIANIEQTLLISILPYIFNSSIILINALFLDKRASLKIKNSTLYAENRRSLVTLIAYHHPSTERRIVTIISIIFAVSTGLAVMVSLL